MSFVLSEGIRWDIEFLDSRIQVGQLHLGNRYIIERVVFLEFLQLRVLLDAEHLVEHLERRVFRLGFFDALDLLPLSFHLIVELVLDAAFC